MNGNISKYQEALDKVLGSYEPEYCYPDEVKLLQELVDKATPYKPKNIVWNEYEVAKQGECKCGRFPLNQYMDDYEYCAFCGQALDWNTSNE